MLSNSEIEKRIREELDNKWELKNGKLVKLFQFSSFMNAIYFVTSPRTFGRETRLCQDYVPNRNNVQY
jgi:hypothetical protein